MYNTIIQKETKMKHIFIINPVAGKGKSEKQYLPLIHKVSKELGVEYEIHRTINIGDGERFTRQRCLNRETEAELLRFYACGGDGTLNEVANGAYGFKNVELGFIPSGTGNDFARSFNNYKDFFDIKSQIRGTGKPIDLLKYSIDGNEPKYCVNMFNIGFDCDVVIKMDELRRFSFLAGASAYGAGVGLVLIKKDTLDLNIVIDDGIERKGKILMMAIGNGKYCGGGFKGLPEAMVEDGIIDVSIVKNVNRSEFIRLIGPYKKGTHLSTKLGQKIVTYEKCKSITVKDENAFSICIDGEVDKGNNLRVVIENKAILFSVPQQNENK